VNPVLGAGAFGAAGLAFLLLAGHRVQAPAAIVPGALLTQPFGCTAVALEPVDAACPGGHFHSGIDLAAPAGAPVLAPLPGFAAAGSQPASCGNYVRLDHGGGLATLYCHLSRVLVGGGQLVMAGDRIGAVGSSGNSTGPHLHFEVHLGGRLLDPAAWLRKLQEGSGHSTTTGGNES